MSGAPSEVNASSEVDALREKAAAVKGAMAQNIEQVQQRQTHLDQVEETSRRLTETSSLFHHTSRNLQRKYFYKNVKLVVIIIAIIAAILLTLIICLIVVGVTTSNSQ